MSLFQLRVAATGSCFWGEAKPAGDKEKHGGGLGLHPKAAGGRGVLEVLLPLPEAREGDLQ